MVHLTIGFLHSGETTPPSLASYMYDSAVQAEKSCHYSGTCLCGHLNKVVTSAI